MKAEDIENLIDGLYLLLFPRQGKSGAALLIQTAYLPHLLYTSTHHFRNF
jgi:hypothetical protein